MNLYNTIKMIFYKLPSSIVSKIYEYDSTYREILYKELSDMMPIYYYQESEIINRENDGLHKMYRDKELIKEYCTSEGKKNGFYKIYFNGKLFQKKNYVDNKLHGRCYEFGIDGSLEIKTKYNNNKLLIMTIYKKSILTERIYRKLSVPNDYKIKCEFHNNKLNGYITVYKNDILRMEFTINNGKKIGDYIKYDQNGNIMNSSYTLY